MCANKKLWKQRQDAFLVSVTLANAALIYESYQLRSRYILAEPILCSALLLSCIFQLSSVRGVFTPRSFIAAFLFTLFALALFTHHTPTIRLSPPPLTVRNHPIEDLIRVARTEFIGTVTGQSKTLADAVQTYRIRTGMHPPPKFDAWFSFAQKNKVQMVDEYDTIQHLFRPFWGLPPSTIRRTVRDAFGAENNYLMLIQIRSGDVRYRSHDDWSLMAVVEMMRKFVRHLPDMDLLFNVHDEPSVVIPNDMINHLVSTARRAQHDPPYNTFSTDL